MAARTALFGFGAALAARLLGASWRIRTVGDDPFVRGEPFIGALWHRVLYAAVPLFRDRDVVVGVSPSRGGNQLTAILSRLGYAPPVRGSTSRRPTALVAGMIRAVRATRTVALTCDGGSGPASQVKPGVLAIARSTGRGVVPIGIAARPCLRFRSSWETLIVPLPFSRVVCRYGTALHVPRDADRPALERLRVEIEQRLEEVTAEAEGLVSRRTGGTRALSRRPSRRETHS